MKKLFSILVVAASAVAFQAALSADMQSRPAETMKPGELKHLQNKMDITGGVEVTTQERATDMALARDALPGIKFAKSDDFFRQYPDRSKAPSGLFVLDSDFAPNNLPAILNKKGLTLRSDGTLVNAQGVSQIMVLWSKLVAIDSKQGSLTPRHSIWNELGISTAHAASPYPLSYVSAWGSWNADNGFCRSLTADTGADAWGPEMNGSRPHTFIQFIETRAWAQGANTADNTCRNCDTQFSQSEASYGCFWPAYGGGTYSWANLKDGSFSWTWQWWGD